MPIKRLVDMHVRWSKLRSIGNSPIVRASAIMPVVGYLILLNQNMVELAQVDPRFRLLWSENPWRLFVVYYGSFALGLAAIIYTWKCPVPIRKYDSAVEYFNAETAFFYYRNNYRYKYSRIAQCSKKLDAWARRAVGLITPEGEPLDDKGILSGLEYPAPHTNSLASKFDAPDEAAAATHDREVRRKISGLLTLDWHLNDLASRGWRVAAATFYVIGFSLLSVPAADTLLGVTAYLLRR